MKRIYRYILTAASALAVLSCNLDQYPTSAVVFEEGARIIGNTDDLFSFEAGIMSDYRAIHGGGFAIMEDVMADGFNAVAGFGNNYGSVHRLDDSFTAGDSYIESYWNNHYYCIKDYNVLIDALDEPQNIIEGMEGYSRMIQGEAYFFRAEAYLNLIRHFAKNYNPDKDDPKGVPLIIHYDLVSRPARSSVHDVYKQIKEDLDSAAVRLASVPGVLMADFPTIDIVNALYARYYLDIQDWDNAVASANSVISTGKYTLSKSAAEMEAEFRDDGGSEAIFQLYGSVTELPSSINAYTGMHKVSDEEYGIVSTPMFIPSQKLIQAYDEGDLRKNAWFKTSDFYSEINGSYYKGDFTTFVKFLGNPELYSGVPNGCQMKKPYMIAEQYLIKAEALARKGSIPDAKSTINLLQSARKANTTGGQLSSIQQEWFRETPGDGVRFTCLKRWGKGFEARAGQTGAKSVNAIEVGTYYDERALEDNDYHFVWPIPSNQIKLNPNLEQNDNYGNN